MSHPLLDTIQRLFQDPPPQHVFEVSSQCLAYARPDHPQDVQAREFHPGTVTPSPLKDNVTDPESFRRAVESFASGLAPAKKPRPAALILPDFAARLQVLDFDTFPGNFEEQQALVRFRMKKTIPFDVESAAVSFYQQQASGSGSRRVEVVVASMSLEITGRYEAPFRAYGFHPGLVTTSAMAAMNLAPQAGLNVIAKLSPGALTLMVTDGASLRLVRCVELEQGTVDEMTAVIHPTLVYVEDEMKRRAERLLLCGFGGDTQRLGSEWQQEFGIPVEGLHSKFGAPARWNAGILGYLQGAR